MEEGYRVVAIAPPDDSSDKILEMGCGYIPLAMDNRGANPFRDALLTWRLRSLYKSLQPAMIWHYTIKPSIYGSIAAGLVGLRSIPVITGLGFALMHGGWLAKMVKLLYRVAFRFVDEIWFLNADDRQLFIDEGLVTHGQGEVLRSEGVNTSHFLRVLPSSGIAVGRFGFQTVASSSTFAFLLIGRMLWDKGVGEYVDAAREIRREFPDCEFRLLGFLDVPSRSAISRDQMSSWVTEGVIKYLGSVEDVRQHIAAADCVVLPSYREGTPRTLLEAASMGRPIITTDAVGCRQVVDDGINGYLVKVRDAGDLAAKMRTMLCASAAERELMGRKGREKIEREFDEKIVIKIYLSYLGDATKCLPPKTAR